MSTHPRTAGRHLFAAAAVTVLLLGSAAAPAAAHPASSHEVRSLPSAMGLTDGVGPSASVGDFIDEVIGHMLELLGGQLEATAVVVDDAVPPRVEKPLPPRPEVTIGEEGVKEGTISKAVGSVQEGLEQAKKPPPDLPRVTIGEEGVKEGTISKAVASARNHVREAQQQLDDIGEHLERPGG